jgi:hypothetical protein
MRRVAVFSALGAVLVLIVLGAFALGRRSQLQQLEIGLAETQAMLAFNHFQEYHELESYLANGCTKEAQQNARFAADMQKYLLADFKSRYPDTWVNKYISDRNPRLLGELPSVKQPPEGIHKRPQCLG